MTQHCLRFATFLAPSMRPVYRFVAKYIGQKLGCRTKFFVGRKYDQAINRADVSFLCGLAYIELAYRKPDAMEPLAAPIIYGCRYADKPIYFSDVIVHRSSPIRSFADLRGCRWSYNEPLSHSGYGIVAYHLARMGEDQSFFGKAVRAGYHQRSMHLVCSGRVDASAIDSHVLALARRHHPELVAQLRVIERLGPSTIQPVVASRHLPAGLRKTMQGVFLDMHRDPEVCRVLASGLIKRYEAVNDSSYDDVREMHRRARGVELALI